MSGSLQSRGLYSPPGSSVRRDSPGKNTAVGCHALLQGIFLTQGKKPRSPTFQADNLPLRYQGSLIILGWIAYPFSRESSQPRNRTKVFCIAGRFFTSRAIREALGLVIYGLYYVEICSFNAHFPFTLIFKKSIFIYLIVLALVVVHRVLVVVCGI